MTISENELKVIEDAMAARDHITPLTPPNLVRDHYMVLADWVPDLVKELREKILQISALNETVRGLKEKDAVLSHEYIKSEKDLDAANRLMASMKNIVDAAVEWWADPNDTTKTIVDLQNAVEAYWEENKEKHVTEKRIDEPAKPHCTHFGRNVVIHRCLDCKAEWDD